MIHKPNICCTLSYMKCQEDKLTEEISRNKFVEIFYEFIFGTNLKVIDFISAHNDKDNLVREIDKKHNCKIVLYAVQIWNKEKGAPEEEMLRGLLKLGFSVHAPNCECFDMPLRFFIRYNIFHNILSNQSVEKNFEIATLLFEHGHKMLYTDSYYSSSLYSLFLFAEGLDHSYFHLCLNSAAQNYFQKHEEDVKKLAKRTFIFLLNHGYDIKKIKYDVVWFEAFLDTCCMDELLCYCFSQKEINYIF